LEHHLEQAALVTSGDALTRVETSLQRHFRDLRMILFELTGEGRELTPALQDEILSVGERVSSEIVAAALDAAGVPSAHLDARQLILTDDRHTQATPRYWETYAKLRRVLPRLAEERVVVLGGFIGATAEGVTTTLGRGGSDLTASIVGAGVNAEEIQIWTDVDGMLSCDPRFFARGYRVRSLSYQEATTLARSGAKVLHPDSVVPAVRQRIPIVIRNSRRPECEGTRITPTANECSNPVKAIAVKTGLTVLELRPMGARDIGALTASLADMCARHGMPAELACHNGETGFVALAGAERYQRLPVELEGCIEARVLPQTALITLARDEIAKTPGIAARAISALKGIGAKLLFDANSSPAVGLIVPEREVERAVALLHGEFFQHVDWSAFAVAPAPELRPAPARQPVVARNTGRRRTARLTVVAQN